VCGRVGAAPIAINNGDVDVSAGRWRRRVFPTEAFYPAVQPQHERRKYLRGNGTILAKFAGLGHYGKPVLRRAEALASAGLGPRIRGLFSGFVHFHFVPGKPLQAHEGSPDFLRTAAVHATALRRSFPGDREVPFEEHLEMIRVNVAEGLGQEWEAAVPFLEHYRQSVLGCPTTAVDARMLPHEWIRTSDGYLKTDGTDHHNDHFFPGNQDIAWDLAGTCIEFRLSPEAARRLVEEYTELSGDCRVEDRLTFYSVAYCAYRLGYTSMAVRTLAKSSDAARFEALRQYYAAILRSELSRICRTE